MGKDLFEEIIHQLHGCQYISDLRTMVDKKRVSELKDVLSSMNCNDYSVKQWDELLDYLFEINEESRTSQEAYEKILDKLNK